MNYEQLAQPLVLVIFGITGDLAQRKLLPALYHLAKSGELPEWLRIVGISRRDVTHDDVYAKLPEFVAEADYDHAAEQYLRERTEMRQMNLVEQQDYTQLLERIQAIEDGMPGAEGSRLYYLSIPSHAFTPIIKLLGETGHNAALPNGDLPRLLIEKPFGYDLASARELIAALDAQFSESQVYRIDHYVAKETVQNILTFRFHNPLFESIWNAHHISKISVMAREKLDIEGRANFYEQTGALRDLIQSHLLQLLAIVTMGRPDVLQSNAIHAEKLKLLQAIKPIAPDEVATKAVRGQYDGYRQEAQNPDSLIETYARVELTIDDDTWAGVPIMLETGKALDAKLTEISVCFRPNNDTTEDENQLIFRIQPQEGITLCLQTKRPGIKTEMSRADMTFDYATAFNERPAEAYERVIVDAIRGDQTLFASSDEVVRSWQIIENILTQWSRSDEGLLSYAKGSAGPQV